MKTAFSSTPIIGYRTWKTMGEAKLRSPMFRMHHDIWSTKEWVKAKCLNPCRRASTIPCDDFISMRVGTPMCGFHCCKSLAKLREFKELMSDNAAPYPLVVGTVELAGLVYEGERGYRGEYARVREILGTWDEVFATEEATMEPDHGPR